MLYLSKKSDSESHTLFRKKYQDRIYGENQKITLPCWRERTPITDRMLYELYQHNYIIQQSGARNPVPPKNALSSSNGKKERLMD